MASQSHVPSPSSPPSQRLSLSPPCPLPPGLSSPLPPCPVPGILRWREDGGCRALTVPRAPQPGAGCERLRGAPAGSAGGGCVHAGISGGKRRLPSRPPAGFVSGARRQGKEGERVRGRRPPAARVQGTVPSCDTPLHGERAVGSAWGHKVPPSLLRFTRLVSRRRAGLGPAWDTLGRSVAPGVTHPKQ